MNLDRLLLSLEADRSSNAATWHVCVCVRMCAYVCIPYRLPQLLWLSCLQVLALFLLGNLLTSCAILPLIFGLLPGRFCK